MGYKAKLHWNFKELNSQALGTSVGGDDLQEGEQRHCKTYQHLCAENKRIAERRLRNLTMVCIGESQKSQPV